MSPVVHANYARLAATAAAIISLVAVTVSLYWPGLGGGFLFDDFPNLVSDTSWRLSSLSAAQVERAAGGGIAGMFGRGLAMLSFGLNHLATGMDPRAMKFTNVVMHAGNAVLVYALTRRLFARALPQASWFTAWSTSLLWAIHPLHVSTVLYVVQRMEIGAATGTLLALLAYAQARERQLEGRRAWPWLCGATAAVALGLGFKETAALAPLFAGLLEVFVFRFRTSAGRPSRAWLAAYGAAAAVALAVFVGVVVPRYATASAYASRDFDVAQRLLTQPRVLAMYLGEIALPLPDRLRFYYDDVAPSSSLLDPTTTLASIVLLVGLAATAFAARRRRPVLALGLAWFLAAHALTSNVIPLELAFEHRNYLALVGAAWALADAARWAGRRMSTEAARTATAALLVALAGACVLNTLSWGEPLRLALALESRAPRSPRATYALGAAMYDAARGAPDSPLWSLARRQFVVSGTLPGNSVLAEQALLLLDARAHRSADMRVWAQMRRKLTARATRPDDLAALHALVSCARDPGCSIDRDQLDATLATAVASAPAQAGLRAIRADFLFNVRADPSAAVQQMREAVRLAPDDPRHATGLAKLLLASSLLTTSEVEGLIERARAANRHGELDAELEEIERLRAAAGRRHADAGAPAGGS